MYIVWDASKAAEEREDRALGESEASLGWTVLGSKWRKPAAQSRMEGRERHTEKGSGLRLKNIKDLLRSDSADKENKEDRKKWRQGEGTPLPVLPQPVSAGKADARNISKSILDNSKSSTTVDNEVNSSGEPEWEK